MHTDLDEKMIAGRLRAAEEEPGEAPYGWIEFQRRRHRSPLTRAIERNRPAAIAAAVLAAVVITAVPFLRSAPGHRPAREPADTVMQSSASDGQAEAHTRDWQIQARTRDWQEQARTRAIEGWLEGLPHDRALVRIGTHAAVTSLQDQIAALDDLMSTERVTGAQPSRLDVLERQRAQLVSSLAQLQYAEMLASANP